MKQLNILITVIVFSFYTPVFAQNIRIINDFSNNAVLSLCQDENGLLWVGTCDGLNIYNGLSTSLYKTSDDKELSGNLIEHIIETDQNIFWVNTNYGLNKIDKNNDRIEYYNQFQRNYKMRTNDKKDVFVIDENYNLFYNYRGKQDSFLHLNISPIKENAILDYLIDSNNRLWIFTENNENVSYQIIEDSGQRYVLGPPKPVTQIASLKYCFNEDNRIFYIDDRSDFYEYNLISEEKIFIANLKKEIQQRGRVSDILKKKDEYFISFVRNGVLQLKKKGEIPIITDIGIKAGIFFLYKDKRQNIVWMGSDGSGLYQYSNGKYQYKSVTFQNKKFDLSKPIRAIFLDDKNTLWLGTKGDGIMRIFNYDINKNEFDYKSEKILTSNNSVLMDNSVFAFAKSHQDILWIGGEGGLIYYSYAEDCIKNIKSEMPVRYVHSIQEQGDSILWIATAGDGILKAYIGGKKNKPELIRMKKYTVNDGLFASNYFFTHYFEDENRMWFGNRGYGAFTMDDEKGLIPHRLLKHYDTRIINDVFAIIKEKNILWLGTSCGLIKQTPEREILFNNKNGFRNNCIHSMLLDDKKNLWLATNKGIIRFDTSRDNFQIYGEQSLDVTEFCDGAAFLSPYGMFFGGVNGFVFIKENVSDSTQAYSPPIIFEKLNIYDSKQDRFIYLKQKQKATLNPNENYFSISFVAINYIDYNNYVYQYKIGDKDNKWIDNGALNKISFTKMLPRKYEIYVKYKNRYTDEESDVYSVEIEILPPWYMSRTANIIYSLLVLIFIAILLKLIQQKNKKRSMVMLERLEHKHKEELYEEKLRFFTNITHEFSTPLTLISGPCERISSYEYSDSYIRKYADIIKKNAERLNALVQEIIEYRRIVTGNKTYNIQTYNVSEQLFDIIATFSEVIERNNISFETEIKDNIYWNTDSKCFNKIIANLISNALKYTPAWGTIKVCMEEKNENLTFRIYNTGKGIKETDKESIFNRYTILDNYEESSSKGLFTRNGLGMAICKSMVELLKGNLQVKSEINKFTEFIINLPELECTEEKEIDKTAENGADIDIDLDLKGAKPSGFLDHENYELNKIRYNILVIDDNEDILFLIKDILKANYNILLAENGEKGLEVLKKETIHLIITDIMMPKTGGIELVKVIKTNIACIFP
jgi:signal transduction histidine kinase